MADVTFENETGRVLVRDGVAIELVEGGEGLDGYFDPDDPEDISLLRFELSKMDDDGNWVEVEDSSYCTMIPVSTSQEDRQSILETIAEATVPQVLAGQSVKRICEELSWLEAPSSENSIQPTI